MTPESNGKKSLSEIFRWITPSLLTIGIFILSGISTRSKDIDDKLFRHLTNDEIHSPRSLVVTKPEFLIYQEMRDKQMDDLKDLICANNNDMKERVAEISKAVQSIKLR